VERACDGSLAESETGNREKLDDDDEEEEEEERLTGSEASEAAVLGTSPSG